MDKDVKEYLEHMTRLSDKELKVLVYLASGELYRRMGGQVRYE